MHRIITTLIPAIALLIAGTVAHADNTEALIEYRQDTMEAIKGHNNAIKAILRGKVPYTGQLELHMRSLGDLLGIVGELFPEGSDFGETEVKDAVWDNPDKFDQAVKEAQQAYEDFSKVVAGGDLRAGADAHKKFGKASCGNCHKSFKKKDD